MQLATSPTGACSSCVGAGMVWDNTIRLKTGGANGYTGHWFMYTPRVTMNNWAAASTGSYGAIIAGLSIMDGTVAASNAAGPGHFEVGALIGGGSYHFYDGLLVSGTFDGRYYDGHIESATNDAIEVVNSYGLLFQGIGTSSAGGTNCQLEFDAGTSGNTAIAITRSANAGCILMDDNLTTPTIATSVAATPSTWVAPDYIQPAFGLTALALGGGLSMGNGLLCSVTMPTVASGGGGTIAAAVTGENNCSFSINIGTGTITNPLVLTFPAAAHGWHVQCDDITTQSTTNARTQQTGAVSTTSVTLTAFTDIVGTGGTWTASDILECSAAAN
jgi:hypothetical protein